MFDWEENQESDGRLVATLCGTRVTVYGGEGDSSGAWCWEVSFADGQVQKGHAPDPDAALAKGKQVAERFLQ